jgi:heme-degrading monooxygenase HmoA
MIMRIWHGWTRLHNAEAYEKLLREEIFLHIGSRKISGYQGIRLLKRTVQGEAEFITIMEFESLDAIKEFAGEDYEKAVVPANAQKLLSRYDAVSQHYEVVAS